MNYKEKIQLIIDRFKHNEYNSINGKDLFELDMNDLNNYGQEYVSIKEYKKVVRERDEYYNQLDDINSIISIY